MLGFDRILINVSFRAGRKHKREKSKRPNYTCDNKSLLLSFSRQMIIRITLYNP